MDNTVYTDTRDIFTDLLTTDLSDFDEKKDKYGGHSLSEIIQMVVVDAKQLLIEHCETPQKERTIAILANNLIYITNNDKKILKKFNIFKLYCAKCSSLKRKDNTNTNLYRCTNCKLVRYCCSECQRNDWVHHKIICKPLTKAISNTEKIKIEAFYNLQEEDRANGSKVSSLLFDTSNVERTNEFLKNRMDCRKERGSSYK